jgi:hypothetical protein
MAGFSVPLFSTEGTEEDSAGYRPYINTGTNLDILNGKFIAGFDGRVILSGGLGNTTATIAEGNKFKSTWQHGNMVGAMERWPGSQGRIYETEFGSIDTGRISRMSQFHHDDPEKRALHVTDLSQRIKVYDVGTETGEHLESFMDYMREIRDEKMKNSKSWTVETEVADPFTGKPYRMLFPTFIGIDSWSEALVKHVDTRNESYDGDTEMKEKRTIHLDEGWNKSYLMRQLPGICVQGGLYTMLTAHLGKKFAMDPGKPNKKDLTHMGQDEMAKGVGPKFLFLMNTIIKIANATELRHDADKSQTRYPSKNSYVSATDLMELALVIVRSKNGASGYQASAVASQAGGIIPGLTDYRNLGDKFKYAGLGSANKVRTPWLDNLDLGRTRIYDQARDPFVARALEITYQIAFIQSNWNLSLLPAHFTTPIDDVVELLSKQGYATSDILHSRGWWTYTDSGIDIPYLSLDDILRIASGTYKPKFIPVSNHTAPKKDA